MDLPEGGGRNARLREGEDGLEKDYGTDCVTHDVMAPLRTCTLTLSDSQTFATAHNKRSRLFV